jgi:hypothetical protein
MTTLSSYLVERKIASPGHMTEALERQAVLGGDLATCLLELRLVREESLTPALAAVCGAEPAPSGELPATSSALLRIVPGEMAHRFGFYPMSETKDGDMFIAVADLLPPAVEEELSFALGVRLRQFVAPVVRVKQAIARDYGFPLDQRLLRLVDQLDSYPSVVPMPIVSLASAPEEQPEQEPVPLSKPKAASATAAPAVPPPADFLAEAEAVMTAQTEAKKKARAEGLSSSALAGWAKRTADGGAGLLQGARDRVRGPITPAAAESALLELGASDEVLRLFFEFARQYFEYAALFVVRGDLAEGHDAWGPGATRDKVVTVGVPLDLPGLLATANKRRAAVLAPLGAGGLDADLAHDLGRHGGQGAFVLPIVVRGRVVALLYGDHGSAPVELATVGDVIALAPLVAAAFERILVKKKVARKGARARTTERPAAWPASIPPAQPAAQPGKRSAPPAAAAAKPSAPPAQSPAVAAKPSAPPAQAPAVAAKPSAPPAQAPAAVAKPSAQPAAEPTPPSAQSVPQPTQLSAPPAKPASPARPKSWPEAEKELAPSSEADMVDEEWARLSEPPDISLIAHEDEADPGPPPATAAAVRPISLKPIPREEPPDLTVVEEDDEETILALLGEIEEHPAPLMPSADRSARRKEAMRRPTPAMRGVGSQAFAADPQPPPASARFEHPLPAVLLHSDLVEKVIAGDKDADLALSEILALGNAAIPAVFSRFPGPVAAKRTGSVDDLPRPEDCGPVLRIVAAMRRLALPFLAIRSADTDPNVRFWATCLLGELHYPDAATAILARMFDDIPDVRQMAARGARSLAPDSDLATTIRFGLERVATRRDEPELRRVLAIEALLETKSYRSVPAIIRVLDEPSERVVKAAAQALSVLTRQGFGRNRRQWDSWWASAGKKRVF